MIAAKLNEKEQTALYLLIKRLPALSLLFIKTL